MCFLGGQRGVAEALQNSASHICELFFSEWILVSLNEHINEENDNYKSAAVNFKSQIVKGFLERFHMTSLSHISVPRQ